MRSKPSSGGDTKFINKKAKFTANDWIHSFEKLDTKQQEKLDSILNEFDTCLKQFQNLKHTSDETIKKLLGPLSLYMDQSPLYMYTDEEYNPSCKVVSCAFGETFPSDKYDFIEKRLNKTMASSLHPILVLSEASGIGKTNSAYHLARVVPNQIVLLITLPLTSLLKSSLRNTKTRREMDILSSVFFSNFMVFGCVLYDYAKNKCNDPGISIIRFLFNRGSELIGSCETFLQDLGAKTNYCKTKVFLMMDEVQLFDTQDLDVPLTYSSALGNAITLYSSTCRKFAPVIMTTTFLKCVETKIENIVSTSSKLRDSILIFSFHFPRPLPIVHSSQVIPFLRQFINIDKEYDKVWKNVAYFIQGPIRRCEQFLQNLLITLEHSTETDEDRYHEIIYTVLNSVVSSYWDQIIDIQRVDSKISNAFHNLAVFGEVRFKDELISKEFAKYLLTNSIPYTFDCTNKSFQVISPIDQLILFNTLKNFAENSQMDWLGYCFKNLEQLSKENISKFTEIILVYFLLNHAVEIFSEFSGSYLDDYLFKATYYIKEIQFSNRASNLVDIRPSTLLINAMNSENVNKIVGDGCNDSTFTQALIIPNTDVGPNLLGVLSRRDSTHPILIPLISSTCLNSHDKDKFMSEYEATNPQNMYPQNMSNTLNSEKESIEESVGNIMKNGKMLRILFHPNANFTKPLEERISEYSSGKDTCVRSFSKHAIMTDKEHLVYEISSCNLKWKQFTTKFSWLDKILAKNQ